MGGFSADVDPHLGDAFPIHHGFVLFAAFADKSGGGAFYGILEEVDTGLTGQAVAGFLIGSHDEPGGAAAARFPQGVHGKECNDCSALAVHNAGAVAPAFRGGL